MRPIKTGKATWTLNDIDYWLNPRTKLVELENPAQAQSYSQLTSEDKTRKEVEEWDGSTPVFPDRVDPVLKGVQELANAEGIDWVYMGEIGAGTVAAFYPPFLLMWMIAEPELYQHWLAKQCLAYV